MNKSDLARRALEYRSEIGLDPHAVLDPYLLAAAWGVDVYRLTEVGCTPPAVEHFTVLRSSVFSGMLIPVGAGAVILENDSHDPLRRRSTMGHEMAHVILGHKFTSGVVDERGCRLSSPDDEKEAAELGGELLLPAEGARRLAFRDYTDEEAAGAFEVSVEVARWRMNATGARLRAQRARAKGARGGV